MEQEKVIIILDGISEGKNSFINIIKRDGYWCWNCNHRNFLTMLAHKLGFEGEHNQKFYEFITEFELLANKYWGFSQRYVENLIDKFNSKEKVKVLIIHNCKFEISKYLQDKYENCFNILITDNDDENNNYCKVMNYLDDGFETQVIKTMRILTKIGE